MLKNLVVLFMVFLSMSACEAINHLIEPLLPPLPPTIEPGPTQVPLKTLSAPPSPTAIATPTVAATATNIPPTYTPTQAVPSATPGPLATAASPTQATMLYHAQTGMPMHTTNFAHAAAGCQWMSVAGQIFDSGGNAVIGLVVHVTGALNGQPFDQVSMTGVALDFGPGGYEIKLADIGVDSKATLSVQVFNLQGEAISNAVPFNTYQDCAKSITLVNFVP